MKTRMIIGWLLVAAAPVLASTLDDLASPDPAVRDAAAQIQRKTWVHAPHSQWQPLLDRMPAGSSSSAALDLLKSFHAVPEGGAASGGTSNSWYRVDDFWLFYLVTDDRQGKVISADLQQNPQRVQAKLPQGFTGLWTTYYVSGQKCNDIQYVKGAQFGDFIQYSPDGSKLYMQRTEAGSNITTETEYYPGGQVQARGQYVNGRIYGVWTRYHKDGTVASTEDHAHDRF